MRTLGNDPLENRFINAVGSDPGFFSKRVAFMKSLVHGLARSTKDTFVLGLATSVYCAQWVVKAFGLANKPCSDAFSQAWEEVAADVACVGKSMLGVITANHYSPVVDEFIKMRKHNEPELLIDAHTASYPPKKPEYMNDIFPLVRSMKRGADWIYVSEPVQKDGKMYIAEVCPPSVVIYQLYFVGGKIDRAQKLTNPPDFREGASDLSIEASLSPKMEKLWGSIFRGKKLIDSKVSAIAEGVKDDGAFDYEKKIFLKKFFDGKEWVYISEPENDKFITIGRTSKKIVYYGSEY